MEATLTETQQKLLSLLDKSYSLTYVDYRDSLDERLDKVQDAIHKEDGICDLECEIDEWLWDQRADSVSTIFKELKGDVIRLFNLEEDEDKAQEIIDETEDFLRDCIYDRADDDTLKDLLRNTSDSPMFYDTNMEIGDYTTDMKERLHDVKIALKIKQKDKTFDGKLTEMLCNASYGGRLVIYFSGDMSDWINIAPDMNTICFSGSVVVAVIDNMNGSGDHTEISHEFSLPFRRENVFIDKCVKYSYTYDVCGMFSDWCNGTNVKLSHRKQAKKVVQISTVNDHIEKEKKLNETYRAGKCTFLDMNPSRHRNTYYINDFPCGTKCKDCGTFWID